MSCNSNISSPSKEKLYSVVIKNSIRNNDHLNMVQSSFFFFFSSFSHILVVFCILLLSIPKSKKAFFLVRVKRLKIKK